MQKYNKAFILFLLRHLSVLLKEPLFIPFSSVVMSWDEQLIHIYFLQIFGKNSFLIFLLIIWSPYRHFPVILQGASKMSGFVLFVSWLKQWISHVNGLHWVDKTLHLLIWVSEPVTKKWSLHFRRDDAGRVKQQHNFLQIFNSKVEEKRQRDLHESSMLLTLGVISTVQIKDLNI